MLADGEFDPLVRRNVVSGMSLVFRVNLVAEAFPLPGGWMHDAWLAWIAAVNGGIAPIPETLAKYRQTGGNVIGARRKSFLERTAIAEIGRAENLALRSKNLQILADYLKKSGVSIDLLSKVTDRASHWRRRSQLPRNRLMRIGPVILELAAFRYHRFSSGFMSAARDALFK